MVNGSTPLHTACELLLDLDIIKTLVEGGSDVNAVNLDGSTPLSFITNRLESDVKNE